MSEMVERVARAMYEDWIKDVRSLEEGWDNLEASHKDRLLESARAGIKAMREPTEAMKNCDPRVHWNYRCGVCGGVAEGWELMIDAALK